MYTVSALPGGVQRRIDTGNADAGRKQRVIPVCFILSGTWNYYGKTGASDENADMSVQIMSIHKSKGFVCVGN